MEATQAGVSNRSVAKDVADYRQAYQSMTSSEKLMLPSERLRELRDMQSKRCAEREAKKTWYHHSRKTIQAKNAHSDGIACLFSSTDHRDATIVAFNDQNQLVNSIAASERKQSLQSASVCTNERPIFEKHLRVKPEEQFNFKNLDTHSRLWPTYKPKWNAERAAELRSHELRGRHYNLINHCTSEIPGIPNK
jgi:hypothetical protein